MKPYVVSVVRQPYTQSIEEGHSPCDLAIPGAMYVYASYLNNWSGFSVKIIDHIDEQRRIAIRSVCHSVVAENGIIHVSRAHECRSHYEYTWSRSGAAFLTPINECMFDMGGGRPGLLAARYGQRVSDTTKAHLFAHDGESYNPACHINMSIGHGQYLKLKREVTCSYCVRKLSEGAASYAGFMRP